MRGLRDLGWGGLVLNFIMHCKAQYSGLPAALGIFCHSYASSIPVGCSIVHVFLLQIVNIY